MSASPPSEPTRPSRGVGWCILVVTATYALAAMCRVGWTWDGAFLFFRILEDGSLPIPHQRWSNVPPMAGLRWAATHVVDLDVLAVIYGGLYFALSALAFAIALSLLRGHASHMRIWVVIGVLFVALPGAMCPTMEVTPCTQLTWPLLAWVWAGCPRAWLVPVCAIVVVMLGLHPVAGALLAMVAMVAWCTRAPHHRVAAWAFSLAAGIGLLWSATRLDAYERAQLHPSKIGEELVSVLLLAPVALVVIIAVWAWHVDRRGGNLDRSALGLPVWIVVLVAGLWFFHDARYWSGCFNYRKLGALAVVPFVWLAARQARRPVQRGPVPGAAHLLVPCLVFAVLVSLGSWSWHRELQRLRAAGDTAGQRVFDASAIPGLVGTPLHHWSGTVTSILVQGRRPRWILQAHGVTLDDEGIWLWSSGEVTLAFDHAGKGPVPFDLSELRR